MILRRVLAAQARIQRAHGRAQLQPDGFRHGQHRWRLGAQVERAVKLQIGADIAHGIASPRRVAHRGVDGWFAGFG